MLTWNLRESSVQVSVCILLLFFHQGGSEIWTTNSETVIASLAFHPTQRLLVIATYNEIHFWDWSDPAPYSVVTTRSEKEKVR